MYKLLIADDESLEREALRLFAAESGLELEPVIECGTGTDAVRLCLLERPDIVVLDINMPGLGGLEVLEKIRVADRRLKVIISSAFNYFEYAKKAMQLGAMDFLVKPVKQSVLTQALTRAVDELDAEQSADDKFSRMSEMFESIGSRMAFELAAGIISGETAYCLETSGIGTPPTGAAYYFKASGANGIAASELARELKDLLSFLDVSVLWGIRDERILFLVFPNDRAGNDALFARIRELMASVLNEDGGQGKVGMGNVFRTLEEVQASCRQARNEAGEPEEDRPCKEGQDDVCIRDAPETVNRVRAFIEEHYGRKIGLDDIADSVGCSKFHICRIFKHSTGSTIVDYLTSRRMEKAKELLKASNGSIKQISALVGYTDPNYFTWTFKKSEGVSPVKYRYENGSL